ncbi:hypothetical protein GGR57DRAFT_70286 [Xylariaceae sp. FL1272]|nr:hypothetical protein GGR57DRAFT_70286 [Xylariaceae sp. FL1272]
MGSTFHGDDERVHLPPTISTQLRVDQVHRTDSINSTGRDTECSSPLSFQTLHPSDASSITLTNDANSLYSPQSTDFISSVSPNAQSQRIVNGTLPRIDISSVSDMSLLDTPVTAESQDLTEGFRYMGYQDLSSASGIAPPRTRTAPPVFESGSGQGPSAVTYVNARRSPAAVMQPHEGAEAIPMSAVYTIGSSRNDTVSPRPDEDDIDRFSLRYARPPLDCHSRRDVHIERWSWLYVTLVGLSIYSTLLSGVWLVVSIYQPQYGRGISTGIGWQLQPSTATLLAALIAKTIELSFVTVFVAVLGQVLTRRAFSRNSVGITLAEITMRNWVIQPGSLITHWENLPFAGTTLLGGLSLTATLCALLYTTASDAMVSPKLKVQQWNMRTLHGEVVTSYANPYYVQDTCQTPLTVYDANNSGIACEDVLYSGQSYQSLITFMAEWTAARLKGESANTGLPDRPTAKHNLYDNTTMISAWIETEYGNVGTNIDKYDRIINNVTLAMPHPNVYAAATDPMNGILQPSELSGSGQYSIRAGVVSPTVNVLCVNMDADELEPLVYPTWPNARTDETEIPGQKVGVADWSDDVPTWETEGFNKTVVDDIFHWGEQYGRSPPIFPMYPIDFNTITYIPENFTDPIYVLAKNANITDYTLCQLQSWETPKCSTEFDVSGTGSYMRAHCEDPEDANAYKRVHPEDTAAIPVPSGDWKNLAREWTLAINLNAGLSNSNASNARILTELILNQPRLNPLLPSMAEALAVLATSTLVAGSIGSTFKSNWTYDPELQKGPFEQSFYEPFHAEVQTQAYSSAHTESWQGIFYPILVLVFVLNVLCLAYLIFGTGITPGDAKHSPNLVSKVKSRLSSSVLFSRKPRGVTKESTPSSDSDSESGIDMDPSNEEPDRNTGDKTGKSANGLVTDFTEPKNLFALAVNSPPSQALAGSCGHGPDAQEMVVPWHVGYAASANHYFFEEHASAAKKIRESKSSSADLLGGVESGVNGRYRKSYNRLSTTNQWI